MSEDLREYVLEAIDDDYVYFAEFLSMIKMARQTPERIDRLKQATEAAAYFIRDGLIMPGDLSKDGFTPWPSSIEESIERIKNETEATIRENREIYPGSIAWFSFGRKLTPTLTDQLRVQLATRLREGPADFLEVLNTVSTALNETAQREQLIATRELLGTLIRQGHLTPGDYTDNAFTAWPTEPQEPAEKLEMAAATMIRDKRFPEPGDIAWLTLPIDQQ
jgi:hypothetical protein